MGEQTHQQKRNNKGFTHKIMNGHHLTVVILSLWPLLHPPISVAILLFLNTFDIFLAKGF